MKSSTNYSKCNIVHQDTTQHAGVEQLLKEVSHPVTAIFHLAGILRDGLLENLTPDSFREVTPNKSFKI